MEYSNISDGVYYPEDYFLEEKEIIYLLDKISSKLNNLFLKDETIRLYSKTLDSSLEYTVVRRVVEILDKEGMKAIEEIIKKRIKKKPSLRKYGIKNIEDDVFNYYLKVDKTHLKYLDVFKHWAARKTIFINEDTEPNDLKDLYFRAKRAHDKLFGEGSI